MSDQQVTEDTNPCIADAANLVVKLLHEQGMFLLDIREAVRALKPASFADQAAAAIGSRGLQREPALDTAEARIELQKSVVARGYQSGDGSLMASLYAANRRQLAEVDRLQTKVADQALTIATLKDELAQTRHLLSEERALTAATVGQVPTPLNLAQSGK
jgi:hypothetical protein